jgi:hypothetical protein
MTKRQLLLLVTCVLSIYGVGNIWPVQVSSYKLWTYVGQREFHEYHIAWWRSIWGVILIPAGLVFLGAILMLIWRPPGVPAWALWVGLALQVALALGTALYWGPLMARLSTPGGGLSLPLYHTLMLNHWLRVAIVTGYAALTVWMLVTSASLLKV